MADIEQFDNPREDIKAAIRAYALEDGAYRIGLRAMNEDEWRRSAISAPARESLRQKQTSLAEKKRNEHAAIDESAFGGTGYAAFGKRTASDAYDVGIARALDALSSSYSSYYDTLPRNQSAGKNTRINTLSYMVSNGMTVETGTLYALSAGLSFEEALAMARDSVRLQEAIHYRFSAHNPQDIPDPETETQTQSS